jgi:hypothetical protein
MSSLKKENHSNLNQALFMKGNGLEMPDKDKESKLGQIALITKALGSKIK